MNDHCATHSSLMQKQRAPSVKLDRKDNVRPIGIRGATIVSGGYRKDGIMIFSPRQLRNPFRCLQRNHGTEHASSDGDKGTNAAAGRHLNSNRSSARVRFHRLDAKGRANQHLSVPVSSGNSSGNSGRNRFICGARAAGPGAGPRREWAPESISPARFI